LKAELRLIIGDSAATLFIEPPPALSSLKENEEAILDYDFIKPWKETLLENRIMAIKSVETIEGEMEGVYRSRSTQAVAVLPLYISDDFFGFISFEDCYEQRTWRKSELDFLTLISEMLSNAFERRKLQLELVQSEERLLQANQLAKLGHWEWNVEDDKVIWSKEIFDFFKYDSENSPPSFAKQKDLYKKDSYNLLQKRVENAIKVGGPYELELQANPEKFGVKYFHIMGIPEMKDGTLVRLFGSMQDITERKLSALQIEDQNYSLRKLNNELDLIMKILSHDLKSPINQAKGLVRLLEIDPTNKEIMGHMNKSIKRLQEITDDLLNLAINDRIKVEPEEIFWDNFVNLCIEEHEGSDGFDQIDWQINIQGKNEFITDSKRLKIVIRNLLSNAVKYRNTDNEKPSFIKVEVDCKEHEVTLEVSDNGLGIAKEKLELIFEMFYQVDKTTKGVGLGLHIVKQMLEKINGKVEVSSVEKEGTTFKVLLPMLT